MKELSFAQNFSLIALNALDSLHLTNAKKVSLRCMAAAVILELYLDRHIEIEEDFLILKQEDLHSPEMAIYQEAVYHALLGKNKTLRISLSDCLMKVKKLSNKALKNVEDTFKATLSVLNAIEEIPALLGCDLEYMSAGISMKEYRSNPELFTRLTESVRAEILEEGPMPDEIILMLWLLRESGCLHDLFSKEELKRVAERIYEVNDTSALAQQVYPIRIHKTIETGIKKFLKIKKEVMTTPTGTGITFVFPMIERSKAVFIETEEYFSNKNDRLRDVIARLESNGHIYQVIREGEVPLIKIDNMIYEAVPSAKNFRIPVHGVRLRKYPLSL